MEKSTWMFFVVFLTMIFLISLWTVDVSVSAMNVSGSVGLTNGLWDRSPVRAYHLGLWVAIASWFSLATIAVKSILRE